tara:strand:+ start:256 stop:507 length:252 start_codon:yes stop_codon:yes gene_type:complete
MTPNFDKLFRELASPAPAAPPKPKPDEKPAPNRPAKPSPSPKPNPLKPTRPLPNPKPKAEDDQNGEVKEDLNQDILAFIKKRD